MSLTILKALPEAGPAWRGGSLIGPVDHELLAATLSAPGYQRAAQPVAPITLDEILGENGLNEVDLLKLDCEGCESSVLGCADPDLLRRIRFITSEYHGLPRFYTVVREKLSQTHKVCLAGSQELGSFVAERREGEADGFLRHETIRVEVAGAEGQALECNGINETQARPGVVAPFSKRDGRVISACAGCKRGVCDESPPTCETGGLASKLNQRCLGGRIMAVRVAINGFGRIGRLVLRAAYEHKHTEVEVVGINDLGSVATNAHLLAYDSVHGRFPGEITTGDDWMDIGRGKIRVSAERDPAKLPWRELNVDVALECTGIFTKREAAAKHLEAGARKVIISAPADGVDMTVVRGVNDDALKPEHQVISNASCTTNCLAPVAFVLHNGIGIERGYMTTIHAYTGDQSLQDTLHSDLRRARAAALSLIPTSTGAARAVGLVLPELKGKLDGTAIRVPTPNVSLIDFKFDAKRETTADEVNSLMEEAAKSNRFRGIVGINRAPTVSVDFNHDSHSSTFDITQTQVLDKTFVRVMSWYDNEWGFSNRMVEVAAQFGAM